MLAALPTELLGRLRFPLAELTKPEVREIAQRGGIPVASRPESQDLCFLAGEGKAGFLARHGGLTERPGQITDSEGRVLGTHPGHHNFTVGQRKGIGIGSSEPLYVLSTDAGSNKVVVGGVEQLNRDRVEVGDLILHRPAERVDAVRLRYRAPTVSCRLDRGPAAKANGAGAVVELERPVRRPAPGQTAVFFAGDAVVGHAVIA
jgi:tRNA-specific 2-thiouridylase